MLSVEAMPTLEEMAERLARLEVEVAAQRYEFNRRFVDHTKHLEDLAQIRNEADTHQIKEREYFVRKDVYEEVHTALMGRVSILENWQSRLTIGIISLIAGLAAGVVALADRLFHK